jgi:prefoldin subunit 5
MILPPEAVRELATHAAEIKHLQSDMDKLVNDVEEIKKTLVAIQKTLAEAKGGWRMLLLIGGAAGTLGAGITQAIHWFAGK